jgi:hypothetical protein
MSDNRWFIRVRDDKFQLVDCVDAIDSTTAGIIREALKAERADIPSLRKATVEVLSRLDLQKDNRALLRYLAAESQRPVELVNESPDDNSFLQYWFGIMAIGDPELRRKALKWHVRLRERGAAALIDGQPETVGRKVREGSNRGAQAKREKALERSGNYQREVEQTMNQFISYTRACQIVADRHDIHCSTVLRHTKQPGKKE